MEYCEQLDLLIYGEIEAIRILKIVRTQDFHTTTFFIEDYALITNKMSDLWVTCIFVDSRNIIYAGCGETLMLFDAQTQRLLDTYKEIHNLSITAINVYEPLEYIITASKDGSIKVWNNQKCMVYEFRDHMKSVTSLLLMENILHSDRGNITSILSSSCNINLMQWTVPFEFGISKQEKKNIGKLKLSRLDLNQPCTRMKYIGRNQILVSTPRGASFWHVNQYQTKFAVLKSDPSLISYHKHPEKPSRIVAVTEDSIRLISPVSGRIITTGYLTSTNSMTIQIAYDMQNDELYSLLSNGDLICYQSNYNPFRLKLYLQRSKMLIQAGDLLQAGEIISCICGAEFYNSNIRSHPSFLLFGGTFNGQIVSINMQSSTTQRLLVQVDYSNAGT
jgi:WD40 repeat protein